MAQDAPTTAQDPPVEASDPEPAPAPSRASLPILQFEPPALYPKQAVTDGVESSVRLQIDVDASGRVTNAQVLVSGGLDFDQAALIAARGFRFTPAKDENGTSVASRIEYVQGFTLDKVATVTLEGRVREAGVRTAVTDATIRAVGPTGETLFAEADEEGRFAMAGMEPGPWQVVFSASSRIDEVVEITLLDGVVATTDVYLLRDEVRAGSPADEEIEVSAIRADAEISERTLSSDEIRYLPGTNGDVVRVVQNLPGVARSPLNTGQLRIRGTAPEDSLYFLDGARIPIVFHFSGLTTVVSSDLLEEVGYFPGSYSVRYGRALGGLVDLRTQRDIPERSNGHVSVDIYQATTFVEQSIGSRNALTVSGRRSYADAILNPILNKGDTTVQAPRYYDFQTRWSHKGENGSWTDGMFLLSDDRFRFLGQGDDEVVQVGFATTFQKIRLQHLQPLGNEWGLEVVSLAGPERQFFEYEGASEAYEEQLQVGLRLEATRPLSEENNIGIRVGVDPMFNDQAFLYDIARPPEKTLGSSRFAPREEGQAMVWMPSIYAETSIRQDVMTLTPGARVDALMLDDGTTIIATDPRLGVRWVTGQNTALKFGAGRHSQFPTLRQLLPESDGNPDLEPEWAMQYSAGIEQQVSPELSFDLTAFRHEMKNLVVGREDRFRFYSGPPPIGPFDTEPYANDGVGQVFGLEGLVQYQTTNTIAFLSATLSRSQRIKRPGGEVTLFEYDQPWVINGLATQRLPRRWRLGTRVRYGSGNPYTPVVNRIYDLERRDFIPVYGERDSDRLPPFFSLDVRVDKDFVFKKWTLTTYLDLQNATYAKNVEVLGYSDDYGEEEPVLSNPPLPAIGLRGEW